MKSRWNCILSASVLALPLLLATPRATWAHAADEVTAPPGAVVIAPRAEARIGQTEIVTVFTKQIFAVFLTRYADDVPITGAKVEASTDLQTADLTETDPGVYSTQELLMSSGRNDMTIKFTLSKASGTGVTSEIAMPLMMPIEAPVVAPPRPAITTASPLTIAGAILAVYALLSAAFLVARRRSPRPAAIGGRVEAPGV